MPKLYRVGRYVIFFWANENNEPIHVHIAEKTPSKNATKIWITQGGGCIIANNMSRIPKDDLNELLEIIRGDCFNIIEEWKKFFDINDVIYYC